jgi:uncharacterized protein YcbK (DUF882 family)
VRSLLLFSLTFCESLLPALHAHAAAKGPPHAQRVCAGGRFGPTANHQGGCVAVLRRDSSLSSGTASKRSRSAAPPKVDSKGEEQVHAADEKGKSALSSVESIQTHYVKRGETIEHLASRYATPQTVLMALNGLTSDDSLRQGQILFVPSQAQTPPARTTSSSASWRRYAKPAKEKGSVDLSTHTAHFVGLVMDKGGGLRPAAVRSLNELLGAGGKHPPLPERLIRLLVKVSDVFGGRAIRVASGYRTNSYYQDSRHRQSAAVDFSIADVPNAVLCEYLRELDDVGVGYYPNSTFVHLDVRSQSAYWIDYAGPGEPPRSSPNAPRSSPRGSKRWLLAEIDALVNQTKKALEGTGNDSLRDASEPTVPVIEQPSLEQEQPHALGDSSASSGGSSEPVAL